MTRVRTYMTLALAGLAVVANVGTAHASSTAGPRALIVNDPAGDTTLPGETGDIAKVTFTTTGDGAGRSYVPKSLVITLQLNDAVGTSGRTQYEIDSHVAGCKFSLISVPGAFISTDGGLLNCSQGGSDPLGTAGTGVPVKIAAQRNTITFSLKFAQAPKSLRAGGRIGDIHAFTADTEPVLGLGGPALVPFFVPAAYNSALYVDEARSSGIYQVG